MKKFLIILIILSAIILVINFTSGYNLKKTSQSPSPLPSSQNQDQKPETKKDNQGTISISVTPLNIQENLSTWNFEIILDTHTGSIDTNLVADSELIDDQENITKPASWEGDPPGGHHRKGILKFNSVSSKPKSLELKIINVDGIPQRVFKWDL